MGSSLHSELVLAFKGERFPRASHIAIAKLSWTLTGFTCIRLEVVLHLLEEFILELL